MMRTYVHINRQRNTKSTTLNISAKERSHTAFRTPGPAAAISIAELDVGEISLVVTAKLNGMC